MLNIYEPFGKELIPLEIPLWMAGNNTTREEATKSEGKEAIFGLLIRCCEPECAQIIKIAC